MHIITNNHVRDIVPGYELPESARADFDYIDNWYDAEFVKYKGTWYDLDDLERSSIPGWDAMVTESFFSGVLFRFYLNNEAVVCGRYYT